MKDRPSNEKVIEMLESGEIVEQYKDMLYYIAHNLRKIHPRENFDELVAEGYWLMMKYAPRYDPKKSTLSTWMYRCLWGELKNYCINPARYRHIPTDFDDPIFMIPMRDSWFTKLMRDLEGDASTLVKIIINSPSEICDLIKKEAPKGSKKAIYQYLKKQGWEVWRINRAWHEVKECL